MTLLRQGSGGPARPLDRPVPVRASSEAQRRALKTGFDQAVRAAGGGQVFAASTRVNPPAVSKYAAQQEADTFAPLDVALDADLQAGGPYALRALAAAQGFDLAARSGDAPAACETDQVCAVMARIAREAGETVASIAAICADGVVTPRERASGVAQIDTAISALNQARRMLEAAQ